MRASELVLELQAAIHLYGNLEVAVSFHCDLYKVDTPTYVSRQGGYDLRGLVLPIFLL